MNPKRGCGTKCDNCLYHKAVSCDLLVCGCAGSTEVWGGLLATYVAGGGGTGVGQHSAPGPGPAALPGCLASGTVGPGHSTKVQTHIWLLHCLEVHYHLVVLEFRLLFEECLWEMLNQICFYCCLRITARMGVFKSPTFQMTPLNHLPGMKINTNICFLTKVIASRDGVYFQALTCF